MKWLRKLLGYTECYECKRQFRKHKNTSCGFVKGKGAYWCDSCSGTIIRDIFSGKNPLERYANEVKNEK